jgi:hypothetical protein
MAPRPLEGELTSSWLYRVAAANLVELEELLSGLLDLHPEVLKAPKARYRTTSMLTHLICGSGWRQN